MKKSIYYYYYYKKQSPWKKEKAQPKEIMKHPKKNQYTISFPLANLGKLI